MKTLHGHPKSESDEVHKLALVGQLTRGLTHEFNNVLQSVMSSMEIALRLIKSGRAPEAQKFLANSIASAKRAAGLNRQLVEFSDPDLSPEAPIDVNALVSSMEELLRASQRSTTRVELALAPGLWTTVGDAHQLKSALLGLVMKAGDALPEGGTVAIATGNADLAQGQCVCVTVTHTGKGAVAGQSATARLNLPRHTEFKKENKP